MFSLFHSGLVRGALHAFHRLWDVKRISLAYLTKSLCTLWGTQIHQMRKVSQQKYYKAEPMATRKIGNEQNLNGIIFISCVNRKSLICIFRIDFTSFVICLLFLNHLLWSHTNAARIRRTRNRRGKKWNYIKSDLFPIDTHSTHITQESKNQQSNATKINRTITNLINFSINCVNIRYLSQMGKCYRAAREWGGMAREHEANDKN